MKLCVVSCNHHNTALAVRERLAFSTEEQIRRAYQWLREQFPQTESVVISTCNRVELYTALVDGEDELSPNADEIAQFLADFHGVPLADFAPALLCATGPDAVRHLFEVASSLDSMVLGEPQIVAQVKDAYALAEKSDCCGPLTHALFQGAIRVSARVRSETRLSEGRVSIASVAVGDFGKGIFDRFEDKNVLVIGAGEMAEETLRYLHDEGAREFTVINRTRERAEELAKKFGGAVEDWELRHAALANADVVVVATGADRPVLLESDFREAFGSRLRRPVFVLDLGTPRDVAPEVARVSENLFLYDIDHLQATCDRNRKLREKEIGFAQQIIDEETQKFFAELNHRATGPVIRQLREEWQSVKQAELQRLFNRLDSASEDDKRNIEQAIDRLINKLLHPPLEVLKDEAREGPPHGLIEALKRLFLPRR